MTDAELISRILSGEENLFADVVERYAGYVWAVCAGYVRNRTECEDIVQESFVQCYRRLDTLRDRVAFPAWLRQVARRQCLVWLRAARRRERAMADYADEAHARHGAEAQAPDKALEREELHRGIRAQINALPAKYREALSIYYLGGHSVGQSARFLGITPDTMKKRLELGRKKLKSVLAGEVEFALASEKPPRNMEANILAAIPFGHAPWLSNAALGKAPAAKTGLLGGSTMIKAAAIVIIGGLGVFGLSFLGTQDDENDAITLAQREGSTPETPQTPESEPERTLPEKVEMSVESPPGTPQAAPESHLDETHKPLQAQTMAERDQREEAANEAKAALEKKLDAPVSLDFEGEHIRSICDFISDYVGLNVVLDSRVVPPHRPQRPPETALVEDVYLEPKFAEYITDGIVEDLELRDVTLLEALEYLLYPLGLDFVAEPGFIWVSSPEKIAREAAREPDERYAQYASMGRFSNVEEALDTSVSLVFDGEHLGGILDFIAKYVKTNIVWDYRVVRPPEQALHTASLAPIPEQGGPEAGYVTDGTVFDITLRNAMLRDCFKALLRSLNLTYSVEPGYVWISSPEKIRAEAGQVGPVLLEGEEAPFLDSPATIDFKNLHVSKILEYLAAHHAIEIALDGAAVKPPQQPDGAALAQSDPDCVTAGLVPDITLRKLPLRHTLTALLRPLNLTFTVKDGTVYVSTRERLEAGEYETWDLVKPPEAEIVVQNIYTSRDGSPMAVIQTPLKVIEGYKQGDVFEHFRILGIDIEARTVTIHSDKDGRDLVSTVPDKETSVAPPASAYQRPGSNLVQAPPGAELVVQQIITVPDGEPRVLVETPSKVRKWYQEGEKFECFELRKIDAEAGTVTIYSEKDEKEHVYTVSRESAEVR